MTEIPASSHRKMFNFQKCNIRHHPQLADSVTSLFITMKIILFCQKKNGCNFQQCKLWHSCAHQAEMLQNYFKCCKKMRDMGKDFNVLLDISANASDDGMARMIWLWRRRNDDDDKVMMMTMTMMMMMMMKMMMMMMKWWWWVQFPNTGSGWGGRGSYSSHKILCPLQNTDMENIWTNTNIDNVMD